MQCKEKTRQDMRSGGKCDGITHSPCSAILALRPAQSHLSEGVTFHMSERKEGRRG
jgi:hypothetical protein